MGKGKDVVKGNIASGINREQGPVLQEDGKVQVQQEFA